MNRPVLVKYKKELYHWLENGYGSVIFASSAGGLSNSTLWEYATEADWEKDTIFVINDEYVEFRKALAEGKVVQIMAGVGSEQRWVNKPISHSFNEDNEYRIKPDEPKFKVGDWIRSATAGIFQCKSQASLDRCNGAYGDWEPWKPKPDEWCWFWDVPHKCYRVLSRYHSASNEKYKYKATYGRYQHCEPFIGTLPTGLED